MFPIPYMAHGIHLGETTKTACGAGGFNFADSDYLHRVT